MNKVDLKGTNLQELQKFVESHGEPKFRAVQILDWLYNKRIQNRVDRLEDMANISNACIEKLKPLTYITSLRMQETDGSRYIFVAQDNNPFYSILKKEGLLLATQIGCSFKCKFCPCGRINLVRNLSTGEIVDQIIRIQAKGQSIQKIVIGGMGEPLANCDSILNTIRIINAQWGLGFAMKNIYLSTCGLAPEIKKLADTKLPIRLIVALHSVDDKIRSTLMSVNDKYPVDTLLNAVKYYGSKTGITVEMEYILFEGINDSYADSKLLIKKLLSLPVKLILVPYEPLPRARLSSVNFDKVEKFLNNLISGNINAEIKG